MSRVSYEHLVNGLSNYDEIIDFGVIVFASALLAFGLTFGLLSLGETGILIIAVMAYIRMATKR